MNLLLTYVICVSIGQAGVIGVSILADRLHSPFVSLLVFFPLFFAMFWLAWRVSVKLTEPRAS